MNETISLQTVKDVLSARRSFRTIEHWNAEVADIVAGTATSVLGMTSVILKRAATQLDDIGADIGQKRIVPELRLKEEWGASPNTRVFLRVEVAKRLVTLNILAKLNPEGGFQNGIFLPELKMVQLGQRCVEDAIRELTP